MEDFSAVAADIGRQIEEKQRSLRAAIELEQRRISSLNDLLKRIGSCGDAFDDEDKKAVMDEISNREVSLQQVQRESKRQEEVRRQKEAILFQLHSVLTSRTKLLDQVDEDTSVLKDHEGLLAFFAKKQLNLTNILKIRMKELVENIPKTSP